MSQPIPEKTPASISWKLIRCIPGLVMAILIGLLLWQYGWRTLIDGAIGYVQAAGAPLFFISMAVLPIVGFPLMPFALTAGPAFAPSLGMPLVIVLMITAVAFNVSLSYWLGRRIAAPAMTWACRKFGWKRPEVQSNSAFILTVIMRSAPGIPFWVQSYLLAAMRVPFAIYLIISTLIPAAYLSCIVVFGQALTEGQPRAAIGAVVVMLALGTTLHFVRKRICAPTATSSR